MTLALNRRALLPLIVILSTISTLYAIEDTPLKTMFSIALILAGVFFVFAHQDYFFTDLFSRALAASKYGIIFLVLFAAVQIYHDQSITNVVNSVGYLVDGSAALIFIPFVLWSCPSYLTSLCRIVVFIAVPLALIGITTSLLGTALGGMVSIKTQYQFGLFVASGSLLEHPIGMGFFMNFSIALAGLLYFRNGDPIFLIAIALFACADLLAMSRGAYLSIGAGLLVFIAAPYVRRARLLVFTVIAIAGIALLGYILAREIPLLNSLLRTKNPFSDRDLLWPFTFLQWLSSPWLGIGVVQLQSRISMLDQRVLHYGLNDPHNSFLAMFATSGALIGAIYLWVFIQPLLRATRSTLALPIRRSLMGMTTMIIVASAFQAYNIGGIRIMSMCLTMMLGCANLSLLFEAHPTWIDARQALRQAHKLRSRGRRSTSSTTLDNTTPAI